MDILFLCVVAFLILLAMFDLWVGVSNDAVNFLNSALGSKAGSFKRVLTVAAIGVFIGAAMSNGMMDIARHGIFRPEHFSFYDIICIFMAVMVTDIIMLDIFNSLGMPTSTTVSMVFELLGASFVVALIKIAGGADLGLAELLNTEKALTVILGIFLSVAIAFVFGTIVQYISRIVFTFNYKKNLKWKIGIYGGLCMTAIIYFLLIKGAKDLTFMTPEVKAYIKENTGTIVLITFAASTVLMQLFHICRINVLKFIVLAGTFALAMAFAGNDLVNFIGVPLTGLASFQDYITNGSGDPHTFMMSSLNESAKTPIYYLIGAGAIMVATLATSKKVKNVTKTAIGLSSQQQGDEMFGSSRIARRLVRISLSFFAWMRDIIPERVRVWVNNRFDMEDSCMEDGAAFDLVRGSVNLVLAGALIALGTSLKLPLSTTFVTFMVAMGTSLADKAWGRESAVFRITGVISVIGGWFLTAGVAFVGAGIIVSAMHYGGHWAMILLGILTIFILIRNNRRYKEKQDTENGDVMFHTILETEDKSKTWPMLQLYVTEHHQAFMSYASESFSAITEAFIKDNSSILSKTGTSLSKQKEVLKNARRKETLCLQQIPRETAIEKNTWFYLSNNSCMSMLYNLRRIDEVSLEHVDNNFMPLPEKYGTDFETIRADIKSLFDMTIGMLESGAVENARDIRRKCDDLKDALSTRYHQVHEELSEVDSSEIGVLYVYINMLQETREMVSSLRKYLRAYAKLVNSELVVSGMHNNA